MQKVDEYLIKKHQWSKELAVLRSILKTTELTEDFKWGVPTYTLKGKNVVGMAGFKSYVGLWFFQGVFLKDKHKLLINAQENKTKGLRQLRFNHINEIDLAVLTAYIEEAIQNQKDGKEIKVERKAKVNIPVELMAVLKQNTKVKKAFHELTPGKQKEYAEYVNSAKQEKTKLSRIEKIVPMILDGIGLNDRYKKC